jgi:hypothetical protein
MYVHLLHDRLHLLPSQVGQYPWLPGEFAKPLLGHLSCQLRTFSCQMIELRGILPFLSTQPQLKVFRYPRCDPYDLPSPFLPSVEEVTLPQWCIPRISSSNLRRIETVTPSHAYHDEILLDTLVPYYYTLTELRIERAALPGSIKLSHYLRMINEKAPHLTKLHIYNTFYDILPANVSPEFLPVPPSCSEKLLYTERLFTERIFCFDRGIQESADSPTSSSSF